nr:PREDICTED: cleft lip and palate transmembrane protein 1-like protein [Bos mutus]
MPTPHLPELMPLGDPSTRTPWLHLGPRRSQSLSQPLGPELWSHTAIVLLSNGTGLTSVCRSTELLPLGEVVQLKLKGLADRVQVKHSVRSPAISPEPSTCSRPSRCGAHTHIPYSPRGQGPHPTGAGLTDTSWENMPDKEKRSPHPGSRTVAHREGPKDAEQPLGKHYSNCLGENDTEKREAQEGPAAPTGSCVTGASSVWLRGGSNEPRLRGSVSPRREENEEQSRGLGVKGRGPDLTGARQAVPWTSADRLGVHYVLDPETLPHRDCGVDSPLSVYTTTRSNLGSENNVDLVLNVEDFDVESKFERTVNVSVPKKTRNNGTLYAYVFLHHAGVLPWNDAKQVHLVSPLTTYMVPRPEEVSLLAGGPAAQQQIEAEKRPTSALDEPVSHWRPRLTLNVMVDNFVFDGASLPADVQRYMKMIQLGKTVQYLPILFIDQLSNRVKDLMVINRSSTELPLTVSYDKISLGRLRFWIHMQDAVYSLQQFGFSEKDADEVKGIFVDTNLYFLALTFFVAAFHLLFDFLAFKNDISFWKKKKSMIGMSTKAVLWRCFSTVVIFLFLLDEQTSLLVLVPAGVGAAIELWKVKKALKMTVIWRGLWPTFQFGTYSESERRTEEYDAQAMKYLSYLLYPLCIGGAIYSLLNIKYKSWYSWLINSFVNGAYAFGFLFMLPQLFVNYKMKSVAHLPWKAFTYKAFNTFIDDVFAFIITMPTSHRLACFRDDVVFLVYLYQRWLYPVDKSRVNEFGESYEDTPQRKPHTD